LKKLNNHFKTDKFTSGYTAVYEELLSNYVGREPVVLELGVFKGESLLLWDDYFENGTIVGLDNNEIHLDSKHENIHIFQGLQQDIDLLKRIQETHAPSGYDIIIDDASHIGKLSKISFDYLFHNCLKDGGIYIVEDWGTGYWANWPDGRSTKESTWGRILQLFSSKKRLRSHDFGMVGFIKYIVDLVGIEDAAKEDNRSRYIQISPVKKMIILPGLVIIQKLTQEG
jgi:hypothetical protein